ncbi:MAG: Crp/Fnr family transcriptional regulator [Lentisphaerae bacterium]|nr:Crp/Fnr family transcriptional regulator [Lentisphaerota bacterium]
MNEDRIKLLQKMPIFGGIRNDVLSVLLKYCNNVVVERGNFFFRENESAATMFVIEKGKVAVLKAWQGHDYLLAYLKTGDCFGEMELIDLCARSASVLAVEDCVAIEIPATALHYVYKEDPKQFAMMYMNMGREVSRRLRVADEKLFQTRVEANLIEGRYVFENKDQQT